MAREDTLSRALMILGPSDWVNQGCWFRQHMFVGKRSIVSDVGQMQARASLQIYSIQAHQDYSQSRFVTT